MARLGKLAACAAALAFGLHVFAASALDTDVPFVTTPLSVTEAMLAIAKVGKADYLIDLGSGDGRIVIMAARQFGARGLGVEIDPKLVEESRVNARRAGVADRAEFRDQDLFATDLTPATVLTMYLLPDVNILLRPKLLALKPGTRVVSHDWDMGDWQPDAELRVPAPEKKLGLDRTSRVMLWKIPAQIDGRWCSAHHPRRTLTIRQRYQVVEGELFDGSHKFTGKLDGATLDTTTHGRAELVAGALVFATTTPLAGTWTRANAPCAITPARRTGY